MEVVKRACQGVQVVFHTASLLKFWSDCWLSPKSELDAIYEVNVGGTRNVIEACIANKVPQLVYTSSCNVAIDGFHHIENGREEDPLPATYIDAYSRTKSIAEKLVLGANNSVLDNDMVLTTAAVRPGGIYGPGEKANLSRAVPISRYFIPAFGSPQIYTDWIYIDNLVHSHILLGARMESDTQKFGGEAFFVSDGVVLNNSFFFKGIFEIARGKTLRMLWIPTMVMYYFAFFLEIICALVFGLKRILFVFLHILMFLLVPFFQFKLGNPAPILPLFTRMEVFKIGMHNYFCIEKAKRELGYECKVPFDEALKRTGQFYKEYIGTLESCNNKNQ